MSYWITGSVRPFDDSRQVTRRVPMSTSNPAMDTLETDPYRMGVELRNFGDVYGSTQPKIWGGAFDQTGSLTHEQDITTFGQAVSFTSFFNTPAFNESPKFNPVAYILLANTYPMPIIFNDGPQAQQEAIIEPLTIPQRFDNIDSHDVAHASRGSLEDGSDLDGRGRGTALFEQFIEYNVPTSPRPWLDQGEERVGDNANKSIAIVRPGYLTQVQRIAFPWTDQTNGYLQSQIKGFSDTTMSGALQKLSINNDQDLRPIGKRSASAGSTVYGPGQARTGTDSLAFLGKIRGS